MKQTNIKKLAIILSIFPGFLFIVSIVSYIICSIAERDLPSGGVNIGLCLVLTAALINIPTILAWCAFFIKKRSGSGEEMLDLEKNKSNRSKLKVVYIIAGAMLVAVFSGFGVLALAKKYEIFTSDQNVREVSSLDQWQARSQLSGFKLLDSVDLPNYYICVYDTGLDEVAFCYYEKHPLSGVVQKFVIYDDQDRMITNTVKRKNITELNSLGNHEYVIMGRVVPIRKDYEGLLRFEFKENTGSGYKVVYNKKLSLDEDSGNANNGGGN